MTMNTETECPVCLEGLTAPIRQCERGHSLCEKCLNQTTHKVCPICRSRITTARNYQMEQLIARLKHAITKSPCAYTVDGCTFEVPLDGKKTHELECSNREFLCEGKTFGNWNCNWRGGYSSILEHFKTVHFSESLHFGKENTIIIDFQLSSVDVVPIAFGHVNPQLFWYKFKLDPVKEKVYWVIQYVGLEVKAPDYYYEFEIFEASVRKHKITEICQNDNANLDEILKSEKCVVLSFTTVKNYLNKNGELTFRYRILKLAQINSAAPVNNLLKNVVNPSKVPPHIPPVGFSVINPVPLPLISSAPQARPYPFDIGNLAAGAVSRPPSNTPTYASVGQPNKLLSIFIAIIIFIISYLLVFF